MRLESLAAEPFAFGKSVEEHEATSVQTWAARFRDAPQSNLHLGAFENGTLIGMATFLRETGFKDRHKGRIYGVYVTSAHRGKGIGHELLKYLIEHAKQDSSLEQILLAVAASQTAAKQLYTNLGFQVYGTEPRALKVGPDYIDEDHMILMLPR